MSSLKHLIYALDVEKIPCQIEINKVEMNFLPEGERDEQKFITEFPYSS